LKKDIFFAGFFLLLSAVFYAFGLFNAPSYFLDEYVHTSRGWVLNQVLFGSNQDDFWYDVFWNDHPPLGYIIIGISGAFFPGFDWINRTRILMLEMWIFSSIFMYLICRKYYNSKTAVISLIIHSFSVGFINLSKQILLDNIGILFLLISIYFVIDEHDVQNIGKFNNNIRISHRKYQDFTLNLLKTNRNFNLSALFFGLCLLTKYTFLVFLPSIPLFYIFYLRLNIFKFTKGQRKLFVKFWFKWYIVVFIPYYVYIIYLVFNGHLLKFIGGILWQIFRPDTMGPDGPFQIWWHMWPFMILCQLIIIFGLIFYNLFIKILDTNADFIKKYPRLRNFLMLFEKQKNNFAICVFEIIFALFLVTRASLWTHYINPLFPFMSIIQALGIQVIFEILVENHHFMNQKKVPINNSRNDYDIPKIFLNFLLLANCILSLYPFEYDLTYINSNDYQYAALTWVKKNLPIDSVILTDGFFLADLREFGFKYVQVFYYYDGRFEQEFAQYGWNLVDYIILSSDQSINYYSEEMNSSHEIILIQSFSSVNNSNFFNIYALREKQPVDNL
jgi:hypothetical protein